MATPDAGPAGAAGGARLAGIWRHPVKSVGHERLARTALAPGAGLPGDRAWAIAHGVSDWRAAAAGWVPCSNFLRVTHAPALAAVSVATDEASGALTFSHPAAAPLTVTPGRAAEDEALTTWVAPLAAGAQPGPYRLAHAAGAMLGDAEGPIVSVLSLASLRALSAAAGAEPEPRRFRGNLWIEGWDAFAEEDLPGRTLRIGEATLRLLEPIGRCRAVEANPATGTRDAPVLAALRGLRGHTNFGLYAEVIDAGTIAEGAETEILP